MSLLATTTIHDFDRFEQTFSTKGAAKRKLHGSRGSTIFRDPDQADGVWVVFDWDLEGWKKFISDPDVPAIFNEAGLKDKPEVAELGGRYPA
jgi:hypothetical protein